MIEKKDWIILVWFLLLSIIVVYILAIHVKCVKVIETTVGCRLSCDYYDEDGNWDSGFQWTRGDYWNIDLCFEVLDYVRVGRARCPYFAYVKEKHCVAWGILE